MESSTADIVRNFFMQERGERHALLNRIGDKIHRESTQDPEWVRVSYPPPKRCLLPPNPIAVVRRTCGQDAEQFTKPAD